MNKEYLKQVAYDWASDKRHLRVKGSIPESRCFWCGRIFLNGSFGISFCKLCDCAMSINRDGPEHDYDSFLNAKEALAKRDTRTPIEFDEERFYFDKSGTKSNFITAAGKIVPTEPEDPDDEYKRLYDLK